MAAVGRFEPSDFWKKEMAKIPDEPKPPAWVKPNQDHEWIPYLTKQRIRYEVDTEHKVGYVIMNRPEKLNAGCPYLVCHASLLARDDPDVKVIVVKSVGRAFCAGYDMSPVARHPEKVGAPKRVRPWGHRERQMSEFYRNHLWDNPKPIIVSAHGFVTAGAVNMSSFCDIVISSEDAIFGYPVLRDRGGGDGARAVWPHYWGLRKAKEICFLGSYVTAQEAYIRGFVNRVVSREKLEEETDIIARAMATLSSDGLRRVKLQMNAYYDGQLGLRTYLDVAQTGFPTDRSKIPAGDYGSQKWYDDMMAGGLANFLRARDGPFAEIDRWWREKVAARPKFEKGKSIEEDLEVRKKKA